MNNLAQSFIVPERLNAKIPKEMTGASRDDVKLMVLDSKTGKVAHSHFKDLSSFLRKGDVLILNNSRTIPASLKDTQGERTLDIRLSRQVDENKWDVLIVGGLYKMGDKVRFNSGLEAKIISSGTEEPLVTVEFNRQGKEFLDVLYRIGEPIRYEYIEIPWSIESYQTVYATVPGSVEMPSAGRAFTWRLLETLRRNGVEVGFLQLHAGLSYYGSDRWPSPKTHPESYKIPQETAEMIREAKKEGRRVIAVGTTVVRALESVGARLEATRLQGTTNLYITKNTSLSVVDGLITGLHEPEATHLDLLSSLIDEKFLLKAYQDAIHNGYQWHEFGDMNLILHDVE